MGSSDKRTRIIEAAVDVFADKGFNAARVSDIAKGAGVADGTIYLYFKNKEDLLLSVFEEKMDELRASLDIELAKHADPLAKIRAFARHHFKAVREQRSVAEVLQVELRLSKKFIKDYKPDKLFAYLGVLMELVREGQARGDIRADVDPFTTGWAFFGALEEIGLLYVIASKRQREFDLDAAADQVADLFVRGIAA